MCVCVIICHLSLFPFPNDVFVGEKAGKEKEADTEHPPNRDLTCARVGVWGECLGVIIFVVFLRLCFERRDIRVLKRSSSESVSP